MATLGFDDATLPPARFSRICIRLESHLNHPSCACEVYLERHVCFDCVARFFEQKMPNSAKVGMMEELACLMTGLAQDARLRVAHYLFHSTTLIESIVSVVTSIDKACRSSHGRKPPYDPTRVAIKLHSMLLRNGPPQEPLLILLNKVLARTHHQPLLVLQDPELWWDLTLGLSAALKTAEQKATLIVQAFSLILEDTEEAASRALISACFQNIAGSLELLRPSHSSAHAAVHCPEEAATDLASQCAPLFQDWRPDLGRAALVIDLAVTSICQQQQQAGCANAGPAGVSNLLKRLEADQQTNIKLDATSGPEWACEENSCRYDFAWYLAYNRGVARQVDAAKPPQHAWMHM
ncbi:hypothetical protein Emag_005713 [Eimeria magna]